MKIRHIRHIISSMIAWALFGYYWSLVAQRRITDATIQALLILSVCVAVIWLATSLWVQHNRRRFAGREDRRQRRTPPDGLGPADALGQTVEITGHGEPLSVASLVVIEVDPETRTKTFRIEQVSDEGSPS